MINFQKDCPPIILNSNVSSFLCGNLQLKNLSARSKEVSGIFKQVESYDITTKQRFQNFNSVLESLVNIRTWEWRMNEESNTSFYILFLEVQWCQQQIDIMNPYHIFITFELKKILDKLLIDIAVSMPHLSILLIDFVFINTFKVMKQRSHELLIK